MKNWQRLKNDSELKRKLLTREQAIDAIRKFFKEQQFHEVEVPTMWPVPSAEPYLEVFETKLERPGQSTQQMFLLTSPEYAMKKLIAGDMGNIFTITKAFRNAEGASNHHNPEFTILEWYRPDSSYTQIMTDCELLLRAVLGDSLQYQGKNYDLRTPFIRLTIAEAFEQYAGINTDELLSFETLKTKATQKGYATNNETDHESLFNQIFLNEVEPKIADQPKPVILYDYPAFLPSLARKKTDDPRFVERFELYLGGLELGNAFGELIDPVEQKQRLETDLALRKKLGKKEFAIDREFIEALETGLPETAGIAIGVDRLVMLMADAAKISDTLFFPLEV